MQRRADGAAATQTKATALYPFVPSGPDFRLTPATFAELGFAAAWERDGQAGLCRGGAYLILQDVNVPELQESQLVVVEIESLDAFWSELEPKDLPARSPGSKLGPPSDFPWGREVHIIDPGSVRWHVRQAT